jgi:chromosomal replication initiation ATPase DnaA
MKKQTIIEIVSELTEVSVKDIIGNSRKANIVKARHLSMHAYRWHSDLSLQKIAALHGKDNHATVIWADTQISGYCKVDKSFAELTNQLIFTIKLKKQ